MEFSHPDEYGYVHPIENDSLISSSLLSLEKELEKIPKQKKKCYIRAQREYEKHTQSQNGQNEIISLRELEIIFLRCTLFDACKAAARLVKYWETRYDLFQEEAFSFDSQLHDGFSRAGFGFGLSLSKTLVKEYESALPHGVFKFIPNGRDRLGRPIIFVNVALHDKTKYTSRELIRASWYIVHRAIYSCVEAQTKGVVYFVSVDGFKYSQFDKELLVNHLTSIMFVFPMRLTCIHAYNIPRYLNFVLPIVKAIIGHRLLKTYSGKNKELVVKQLKQWGLSEDVIPVELGGTCVLDHLNWLEQSKRLEEQKETKACCNKVSVDYKLLCTGSF